MDNQEHVPVYKLHNCGITMDPVTFTFFAYYKQDGDLREETFESRLKAMEWLSRQDKSNNQTKKRALATPFKVISSTVKDFGNPDGEDVRSWTVTGVNAATGELTGKATDGSSANGKLPYDLYVDNEEVRRLFKAERRLMAELEQVGDDLKKLCIRGMRHQYRRRLSPEEHMGAMDELEKRIEEIERYVEDGA